MEELLNETVTQADIQVNLTIFIKKRMIQSFFLPLTILVQMRNSL